MFRLFFCACILIVSISSCLNPDQYLAEPLKTPQDSPHKNYPEINSPGNDYYYQSGFFVWNKSNRKYEYRTGHWEKQKPGYYWDPGEWKKYKYGYKYAPARYRKVLKQKIKPA